MKSSCNNSPEPVVGAHGHSGAKIAPLWWAGLLIGLALLLLRGVTDPDVWTHLTIGREVVRLGAIPAFEFYVAPLAGEPGHFNEWGYGVLLYLVYQAGGVTGLALFNAVLAAAIFALFFQLLHIRTGGRPALAILLAMCGMWLADFRLAMRPEMVLYLALFSALLGLEQFRRAPRLRWLAPIVVSGFLLPQFHPSVLIVFIAVGAHTLDFLRTKSRRQRIFPIAAATALSALLSGINPYGFEQLLLPLNFARDTDLLSGITELLPALSTEVAPKYVAAGLAGLAGFALARRRSRLGDALLFVIFAVLAYRHSRNVAIFGLLALLPLATAIAGRAELLPRRAIRMVAALAVFTLSIRAFTNPHWGAGIDTRLTPLEGARALTSAPLHGPVLGLFHLGNYLAWSLYPGAQVIADARHFGYNKALHLHNGLFSAAPGWEREFARAKISAVVTPMTLNYSGEFIPLAEILVNSDEWNIVVSEPASLTFLPAALSGGKGLPRSVAWERAIRELEQNLALYPDSDTTRRNLARARELQLREEAQ